MKKIILSISVLFLYIDINNDLSCNKESEVIVWAKNVKLSYADFKGEYSGNPNYAAETFVGIKFDYIFIDSLKFDVICYVNKFKSWSLENSEYVLNHEQGHFDIGEIYARKLRKKIIEYKKTINNRTIRELDSAYYFFCEELLLEQKKYDKETTFPRRNREIQFAWDRLIKQRLDSLNGFERNNKMDVRWKKKIKIH